MEGASYKYPGAYAKIAKPYESILDVNIKDGTGKNDKKNLPEITPGIQEQISEIGKHVNESIQFANASRKKIKEQYGTSVNLLESAFCAAADIEAKERRPAYDLAKDLTSTDKFYLRSIYKAVKAAHSGISKPDAQALTILFGVKEVKAIDPHATVGVSRENFEKVVLGELKKAGEVVAAAVINFNNDLSPVNKIIVDMATATLLVKQVFADKIIKGDLKDNPVWESELARHTMVKLMKLTTIQGPDILNLQNVMNQEKEKLAAKSKP
jgi:hypothetical protein